MSRWLGLSFVALASTAHAADDADVLGPAPDPTAAPIIGGTAVPPGKWPDTVAVLGNMGSCTGTLIAPDVVLTAGHCAQGMTQVVANTTNYAQAGGIRSTIKTITAYPNWETTYDIAVIVLDTPITGVTPRPIGTSCTFETFSAKPTVRLVGFGLTDNQAQGDNTALYEVDVPVTDPTCATGNGCKAAVAPGGEFIAGGGNKDSCNGDSGGPVYLNTPRGYVVIGAVSRALSNATVPCGEGGIYVRTDKLVQWIEQTAGKSVSKDMCNTQPPPDDEEGGGGNGTGTGTGTGGGNGTGNGDGAGTDVVGGCSTTGSSGATVAFLLLGLAALRRRRSH